MVSGSKQHQPKWVHDFSAGLHIYWIKVSQRKNIFSLEFFTVTLEHRMHRAPRGIQHLIEYLILRSEYGFVLMFYEDHVQVNEIETFMFFLLLIMFYDTQFLPETNGMV